MKLAASSKIFIIMALFVFVSNGYTATVDTAEPALNNNWALLLYGGTHAQNSISDIITFDADYAGDNHMVVTAVNWQAFSYQPYVSFEIEGQLGRHFGDDVSHWEFVTLVLGRWHAFPWDDIVRTSFAFGSGFSSYTEISRLEQTPEDDAQRLLGYLAFELTFGLPQLPRWDLLVRIHHRSGMKGIIGEGSSNFLAAGLKYSF